MPEHTLTLGVFNERSGWTLPAHLVERVRAMAGEGTRILTPATRTQLVEAMPQTNYLFGLQLTADQLREHLGPLEWIQLTHSSGDATAALRTALEKNIRVTSAAHIRAPQIAEHIIALTLTLTRGIHRSFALQSEHHWDPPAVASHVTSLRDSTVGLVSFGAIAEATAQRLKAFGARIIASLPADDPAAHSIAIDECIPTQRIRELFERSDVAIVATTRIPETEALIGKRELKRLRDGAFLVCVSRGGVIEESALLDALRSGRLAGVALDSFETEPLPTNAPYWTMPNVIVTPHVAAATPAYWDHAIDILSQNLGRLRDGKPLIDEITADRFHAQRER